MAFLIFRDKKLEDFENKSFIINSKENSVFILVNPDVFDKDVVINAAYSIQEFANVVVDSQKSEDSEKSYFLVKLVPHSNTSLDKLAMDFNNRLVNYANYKFQAERYKEIKEKVLSEVYSQLRESDEESEYDDEDDSTHEFCQPDDASDDDIDDMVDDVQSDDDDILIPWEDKFSDEIKDKNDIYLDIAKQDSKTENSEKGN